MEVKEGSWHYWLYEMSYSQGYFPERTTNLCKYFWRVVGGMIWLAFMTGLVGAVLGGIGFMFYKHTLVSCTVAGAIAAIAGLLYLYFYVTERFDVRAYRKTLQPGYQEPEPSLLRAYFRAKKEKVCPLITVVKADEKQ